MRYLMATLALLMLLAPGTSPAIVTAAQPSIANQLQSVLDVVVTGDPPVPGVLLYVNVLAKDLEWSGAAGLADRATGEALTPEFTFRIASYTKTYTAAAALRLVEGGKLDLDHSIAELLASETVAVLRAGGYDPDAILVRHLHTHASGLYDYAEDEAYQAAVFADGTKRWTRLEQVQFAVDHGQPLFAPGTGYTYSDTGYVLLGELIERASGRPLAAAFRELLDFEDLGLTSTYLEGEEPIPATAAPRELQYYGELDATDFDPTFDLYGGGGLVANTADLGRFYRAFVQGAIFDQPQTLETMLTIPASNADHDGAMGIFSGDYNGTPCWNHAGFWGTAAFHCPAIDLTITFSVNDGMRLEDVGLAKMMPEVFSVLIAAGLPIAAAPSDPVATPPAGVILPDPSECQTEPRPIAFFEQIIASPPADYTPPSDPADPRFWDPTDDRFPWTLPAGEPVDAAVADEAFATLQEALACLNGNDPVRFLELISHEMVRTFFAMAPLPPEAIESFAATPEAPPRDQWLGVFAVLDARMLADGRIAILADTWDPTQPPYGRSTDFAILVKSGDRWLLDALIENVEIVGGLDDEATPAA